MHKKLLLSGALLAPLAIAPVAIIASCATTLTPAQAIAETLNQTGKVTFQANKGTYGDDAIKGFLANKDSFLNEIDINVENKDQFKFSIDAFEKPSGTADQPMMNFKIKVVDNKTNDEAISSIIQLGFTYQNKPVSANVQAAVKEVNEAFENKSFKVKDGIQLKAAHLKFMSGLTNDDLGKIDAQQVPTLLDKVFEGYKKSDSNVKLSVAQFGVQAKSRAQANATIKLQLQYSDVSDGTSAKTNEFSFDISYDDQVDAASLKQVWDLVVKDLKWLKFNSADGYPESEFTVENFVKPEYTNFEALKTKFFPTQDWTYKVPNGSDFSATKDNKDQTKMIVKFKIESTKNLDTATSDQYTIEGKIKTNQN